MGEPTGPDSNGANSTGTMDPVEIEYLEWDPEGSSISIHMHPGVLHGIARDVIEGLGTLPRPVLEVGGLLLGRVTAGPHPAVWIERYERIECEHRFGPRFILNSGEMAALEEAAAHILAAGQLSVVGLYRSNTRTRFELEESDLELMRRYFSDSSDLVLLIRPTSANEVSAQFHAWDRENGSHTIGEEFPFHGHVLTAEKVQGNETASDAVKAPIAPVVPSDVPRENPRRLVPDFVPSPVEPAPSLYGLNWNAGHDPSPSTEELPTEQRTRDHLKKWLPLAAALLLVGGILWLLLQPHGALNLGGLAATPSPAPAQAVETARPIGLYVDPAGPTWRVLWNPNATALHDARNVQLFVREKNDEKGDDQNRIELSPRDLASGTYEYPPAGNDVTFRLEVTDRDGRVSAESFRLVRAANPPTAPIPAAAPPHPALAPAEPAAGFTQPKATYRAPPVIAAGIRPRIKGTIAIDVRVHIDARGRVVSAAPVARQRSGLDQYLAGRAVQAARLWRFEPARENGKAVEGRQILHFVFDK
ncbi:MAG TPA: hypothetical protein VHY84_24905 [Bryobacteraceae bacterium]|nr:hypothetical protein [Bryobacteraceae bacterium]